MGETRVDLLHLLEDLRDAYPGPTEETVLTETVANALDSRATTIAITTDPSVPTVSIVDDGAGMRRRELARYHDLAATTKVRGAGIGFAGVGIKIALLVCDEVLTETRLGRHHVATVWGLTSRRRAPWKWVTPPGLVAEHGTAVRLRPTSALSPLVDPGFIETVLRRHFQPLLDPLLADVLAPHYPRGVRFFINGRPLERRSWTGTDRGTIAVRLARKRKPSAAGYVIRDSTPLRDDLQGVAVSTFGKVIKRGWEWLGTAPVAPEHVGGLIETPALAACLTLSKTDFIRAGARGATYLAYRRAIQEAIAEQLARWGDALPTPERARRRTAGVERDLEAVLADLADEFPLLSTLVEARRGGQRRLPIGEPSAGADGGVSPGPALTVAEPPQPATAAPPAEGAPGELPPESPAPEEPGVEARLPAAAGARRAGRYGLGVQFERRPDDPELARLVESTVWINEAHPAYRRAVASRAESYHIALAAAMALASVAVEAAKEHAFISAFLASWGAVIDRPRRGRRR